MIILEIIYICHVCIVDLGTNRWYLWWYTCTLDMSHVIPLKSRSNSIKGDVGCTLPTSKCWSLGVGAGLEEPKLRKLILPDWISVVGEIFTRFFFFKLLPLQQKRGYISTR